MDTNDMEKNGFSHEELKNVATNIDGGVLEAGAFSELMMEDVETFLRNDMKVKDLIGQAISALYNVRDDDIKKQDKLHRILKEIISRLGEMAEFYTSPNNATDVIEEFKTDANAALNYTGVEPKALKAFVGTYLSDMNPDLIDDINQNCIGYELLKTEKMEELMNETESANDILHLLHSCFLNDETIYKLLPVVAEKLQVGNDNRVLYVGDKTDIADDIFENIDSSITSSEIQMLSVASRNKIYMMMRGLGHATVAEIDTTEVNAVEPKRADVQHDDRKDDKHNETIDDQHGDKKDDKHNETTDVQHDDRQDDENDDRKIVVRYFIPKICNEEKVNKLIGVERVRRGEEYINGEKGRPRAIFACTRGYFDAEKEGFGKYFVEEFMKNIPTDKDIDVDILMR